MAFVVETHSAKATLVGVLRLKTMADYPYGSCEQAEAPVRVLFSTKWYSRFLED